MQRHIRFILPMALFAMSALFDGLKAQINKVEYLWLVDTSGERNIYIESMQHSIDTFYVEATKRDDLHVYNFAKNVASRDDVVDSDFGQYSDMGRMLQALDSLIRKSKYKYVRAFVLSDFLNNEPIMGPVRMNTHAYSYLRESFEESCRLKNVQICLLVLPPSSVDGSFSLSEVKSILPIRNSETYATTPDGEMTRYLLEKIDAVNQLRGIYDEPEEVPSPIVSYIILGLFFCGIIATAVALELKSRK